MKMSSLFLTLLLAVTGGLAQVIFDCTLEDSATPLCGFTDSTSDNFDWTLLTGSTSSANTGPSVDHTLASSSGHYLYIEATNKAPGEVAKLVSPALSLDTSQLYCLTFWYHMWGEDIGELAVSVTTSSVTDKLWTRTREGTKGVDAWQEGEINLGGDTISIEFSASKGGSASGEPFGDIAIDDFVLQQGSCGTTPTPTPATTPTPTTTPSTTTARSTTTTTTTTTTRPTTTPTTTTPTTTTTTTPRTTPRITTPSSTTPRITSPSSTPTTTTPTTTTPAATTTRATPPTPTPSPEPTPMPTAEPTATPTDPSPAVLPSTGALWGLEENIWIIILVCCGALVLILLVIICIQACAIQNLRRAKVNLPNDYSEINYSTTHSRKSHDDYITAYDDVELESKRNSQNSGMTGTVNPGFE